MIRMHGGYQIQALGESDWVFAVAPRHPLAIESGPLSSEMIQRHRVVAVGDTGRVLPGISIGLLHGQDTLTVPTLEAKLAAQLAGLGCGHLPRALAAPHLASGALLEKQTSEMKSPGIMHIAWRSALRGKALKWFLKRLAEPATRRELLN